MEPDKAPEPNDDDTLPPLEDSLTKEEILQREWHKAYIEQQRRMRCPGCGEGDEHF